MAFPRKKRLIFSAIAAIHIGIIYMLFQPGLMSVSGRNVSVLNNESSFVSVNVSTAMAEQFDQMSQAEKQANQTNQPIANLAKDQKYQLMSNDGLKHVKQPVKTSDQLKAENQEVIKPNDANSLRNNPLGSETNAESSKESVSSNSDSKGMEKSSSAASSGQDLPFTSPTHIGGYLHNPKPPYPEFSEDVGEQGTVVLSVMVEPNGRASSVNVVKSSGYSRLDNSARDTVRNQYRFIPAKRGNQPIAYRYKFSITFKK